MYGSEYEPINETYSFELVSKCTAKRNIQFRNNVAGCQTEQTDFCFEGFVENQSCLQATYIPTIFVSAWIFFPPVASWLSPGRSTGSIRMQHVLLIQAFNCPIADGPQKYC